jgi:hypothetical protein
MRKIALLFIFSLLLFSCEEKFPENPDWLNEKINQMETQPYYFGTVVYAYEWNKEHYYLISIGLSSCVMCEFYDYQGVKVVWTDDKIADFNKNGKKIKVVWQRDI